MKYIRTEKLGIVIFGEHITHEQMARKITNPLVHDPIVSAGFVGGLDDEYISCYGESVSLGVKSQASDTEALRWAVNL